MNLEKLKQTNKPTEKTKSTTTETFRAHITFPSEVILCILISIHDSANIVERLFSGHCWLCGT